MNGYEVLQGYINVEYQLRNAETLLELKKEEIYSKMYGEYFTDTGILVRRCMSVENAAISTIELDELHENEFSEHYKKRKLLYSALGILSNKEREAFNCLVWDNPSKMSEGDIEYYGMQANKKLCSFIEKYHLGKAAS